MIGPEAGPCERGHELSGSVKGEEFLLMNESAQWSQIIYFMQGRRTADAVVWYVESAHAPCGTA